MRQSGICVIFVFLLPFAAQAATGPISPKRISLSQAIQIALRDNRTLRAARFGSESARAEVGVARGAMLPHLDALENFSDTNNPVQVFSSLLSQQDFTQSDFALDSLNHPGFLSNFQSQIRLAFPLFAGGRLIAGYRAAKFAADAEQWQVIRTKQRVEFDVIESYYTAVLAERQVAVVDRALDAARAHLARTQDMFAHGMAVKSDVLRTEVLVGTLEQQRIEAASNLHIAWASLAHILGNEDESIAPLKNPAGLGAARPSPGPMAAMMTQAEIDRPEIKIANLRVNEERQAVSIARADYLPTVEIAGVYENDSEHFARAGNNGALLVTGKLNLFNGLATQSKVDAARAALDRARVLARDLRYAVRLEVETAYRNLVAAEQALVVAKRDTAYADSALKILEDRYGSGLATNVAVLDAQSAREKADLRLAAAEVSVAVDRAALDLAIGTEPSEL